MRQQVGLLSGLIDYGAAVDHIDQSSRQGGRGTAERTRREPDGHDRGLAETGRDVARSGDVIAISLRNNSLLPRKGVTTRGWFLVGGRAVSAANAV